MSAPWTGPYMGRIIPFCRSCQEQDWKDQHPYGCRCTCHAGTA